MNDPAGLIAPLLILGGVLAAKALGLAIGAGGLYWASKRVENAQKKTGRQGPSPVDALEEVLPKTAAMSLGSGLAGTAIVTAPLAVARGVQAAPKVLNLAKEAAATGSTLIGTAGTKVSQGGETVRKTGSKLLKDAAVGIRNVAGKVGQVVDKVGQTVNNVQKTVKDFPYTNTGQNAVKIGEGLAGIFDSNAPVGSVSKYTQRGALAAQVYNYIQGKKKEWQASAKKLFNDFKAFQEEKQKQLQKDEWKDKRRRWR